MQRFALLALVSLGACISAAPPQATAPARTAGASAPACEPDNGGLVLPDGFCALVVGATLGPVRQVAVAPNGDLYAAVSAGRDGSGGGVLAFRDTTGDGHPDVTASFGAGGGNDVELHDGHLYFALNDRIVRWRLEPGRLEPAGEPETVVAGLPADGGHVAKSIAFDGDVMYVNVGSRSNSCQEADRAAGSKGLDPCTELERRGGIWRFAAGRAGQTAADGTRFATGLRNAMALAVQPGTRALFAAVHGMDMLAQSWGFSAEVNANNPAEIFARVEQGQDYGWPYCYFSNESKRLVLAPEYGGDGTRTDRCADRAVPLMGFPGHWAPMALAFHPGTGFGEKYAGGAFIAWHGSWNRAPLPQEGYRVVFVPFRDGRPTGEYETFAALGDGPTALRASGIAVAPDGSLYISADRNATIWRVFRRGGGA
jgi:glucose/arabinose dehydrogenase